MVMLDERLRLLRLYCMSGTSCTNRIKEIFENERRKKVAKASTTVLLEFHFTLMCLKISLFRSLHIQDTTMWRQLSPSLVVDFG